jgi:hypothetical protein
MRGAAAAALAYAAAIGLIACGNTSEHAIFHLATSPTRASLACIPAPGAGVMGACTPRALRALPRAPAGREIPDVSEYQGCALHSEAIFRVYEAGTNVQDARAACHARELRRLHAWSAAYAFVRTPGYHHAGSCTAQAQRTVAIVRSLGGVTGPVIQDAEVPLPRGFVACFNNAVRAAGQLTATYTSTGTASGGPFSQPLWLASYGARPGCIEGICRRVAWQFSSEANCRGVYGDCSIDEGITSIVHAPRAPLEARQRALRRVLAHYGCRRRARVHAPLGPRCRRWFVEGRSVGEELARLPR